MKQFTIEGSRPLYTAFAEECDIQCSYDITFPYLGLNNSQTRLIGYQLRNPNIHFNLNHQYREAVKWFKEQQEDKTKLSQLDIAIKIRDNGYDCDHIQCVDDKCPFFQYFTNSNHASCKAGGIECNGNTIKNIVDKYIVHNTPKPKTFRTADGYDVEFQDNCYSRYALEAIDKYSNHTIGHLGCSEPECIYFKDSDKADCFLQALNGKTIQCEKDNIWHDMEGGFEQLKSLDWTLEYRIKPNTAKTRDGVEIEVDERSYSINKLYVFNPMTSEVYNDNAVKGIFDRVFNCRDKAELFAEGVKGKQLQVYYSDIDKWRDIHYDMIHWSSPIEDIRVKPEEDKHAAFKEAYRNGKTIQLYSKILEEWIDFEEPDMLNSSWNDNLEYRVKPEEDKFAELKEACKKGAIIQYYDTALKLWIDTLCNKPSWNDFLEYRKKPKTKYIPFDTINYDLYGKRINHKTNGSVDTIFGIDTNAEYAFYFGTMNVYTNEELFNEWIYEDGSTIGKSIEE